VRHMLSINVFFFIFRKMADARFSVAAEISTPDRIANEVRFSLSSCAAPSFNTTESVFNNGHSIF
jgi:hypothetical protein